MYCTSSSLFVKPPRLREKAKSAIIIGFMAKKHSFSFRHWQSIALGTVCAIGAFAVGLETAGNVQPFQHSEAALEMTSGNAPLRGDINENGTLDVEDASMILAIAENLETATPEQVRRGDTDGDLVLTTKDALRVLHVLSLQ